MARPLLELGVVGSSRKVDERRLPIHPQHIDRIDPELLRHMAFEEGYGEAFGVSDALLGERVGSIRPRGEILGGSDIVLLPKPQPADLAELPTGAVLWGWPHCVQDREITQIAIDRKLTLIAFEAMTHPGTGLHVFHMNNELAGYCSVLHALQLSGSTGDYGRRLRAVVLGFGATARGAVTALNAHGVYDVDVLTQRDVAAVGSPIHSARMVNFIYDDDAPYRNMVTSDDGEVPLVDYLAEFDVVVNCSMQDTDAPQMLLRIEDLDLFRRGSMIVDVSCDHGMVFSWAHSTTFEQPIEIVGGHVSYYAVDHSPSYLWNSATWEISEAVLPFLETVMRGPEAWALEPAVSGAIEIRSGELVNPRIASFQGRG